MLKEKTGSNCSAQEPNTSRHVAKRTISLINRELYEGQTMVLGATSFKWLGWRSTARLRCVSEQVVADTQGSLIFVCLTKGFVCLAAPSCES